MIISKVNAYIRENGIFDMIDNSSKVIVGFSGGADSSVMLYLLIKIFGEAKIAACHLNHMIRGEEAERDMKFAERTAAEYGIDFYSKRVDVPSVAKKNNMGLEEAARKERYEFFSELERTVGENVIVATAHNMSDNLETVVFNMARGTGLSGIAGIAPIRDNIVRPLLCLTSEEIRSFAKEHNIEYVLDSTNSDDSYTRNHIRLNIAPLLREINPKADEAILRLSEFARSDEEYLSREAQRLVREDNSIDKKAFAASHNSIQRRAVSKLFNRLTGNRGELLSVNIKNAVALGNSPNGKSDFKGLTFVSDTDKITFEEKTKSKKEKAPLLCLEADSEIKDFNDAFAVCLTKNDKEFVFDENIYNLFIKHSFSFDRIYGSIFVRERMAGDEILAFGHHKKLKKLLSEKKIPLRYRDKLPVFCDEGGIFYVPKVCFRDGVKGDGLTVYVLLRRGI